MDDEIRNAIHAAYEGEAKAVVRLRVFAEKAVSDGYPQISRLFDVISRSEEIHCRRALRLLKDIRSTEENLAESFESEEQVAGVAYGNFVKIAEEKGERAAGIYFSQSKDVEEVHARLYKEAMNHILEDNETTYYLCSVCGYISDGILPDECPVCGVGSDKFLKF